MANLFENNKHYDPIITFIIGNGFDLSLNMKTRYSDVYSSYVDTPSFSNTIAAFKNELKNREPYDKWADFEMGMAEYAETLSSEEELIECVRDFKSHMTEHLKKEDKEFEGLIKGGLYDSQIVKELNLSFEGFYRGFSPNVQAEFDKLTHKEYWNYNVITFNYTKSLEHLYEAEFREYSKLMDPPLHIHGDLYNGVVLGVDNIDQIKAKYELTKKGRRAFVKTIFNDQYDRKRVMDARSMILHSSIICTYGFSMGESDRVWVELLSEWLSCDQDHHLVVFKHDTGEYNRINYDELMDVEDERREKLLWDMGIYDVGFENQIHIPVGYDIFNFEIKKIVENRLPEFSGINI